MVQVFGLEPAWLSVQEGQGVALVGVQDFGARQAGVAPNETYLVEGLAPVYPDGVGPGDYFQVHRSLVSGGDVVKAVAVIDDDPGEDVQPTGGTAGVGPGSDIRG